MRVPSYESGPDDLTIPRAVWAAPGLPWSHMLIWAYFRRWPHHTAQECAEHLGTNEANIESAMVSFADLVAEERQAAELVAPPADVPTGPRKKKRIYAGPLARKNATRRKG